MSRFGSLVNGTALLVTTDAPDPGCGGMIMLTGPEVAPNGTTTVRPVAVWQDMETLVPFAPEKTICGVSMAFTLNVASMVNTSPALAEVGVIELSTTGTKMVAVELPNFVGSWTLVAVIVTLLGLGGAAGAVYCPLAIVPTIALPPPMPFTDQLTLVLNAPVPMTCAVNAWVAPTCS